MDSLLTFVTGTADGLCPTEGTFSTLSVDEEGNGAHLSLESACGAPDCVRSSDVDASDEKRYGVRFR